VNDFYRHRRVLVVGGLGFIGSNLVLALVERGAVVTVVDSLVSGQGANLFNIEPVRERVAVNIADIRDQQSLGVVVRGPEVIFSLAAQVSHIASMRDPLTDQDINCKGQLSLLECCRRHNPGARLVFTSTRQLYGRPRYLPVDEQHPVAPVDVNGVSKYAAEMYYRLYFEVYGLRSVILRLTNTYGPRLALRGAWPGFVSVFIRQALTGSRIDIFGTGRQRRDFNYVDDVVEALLLAGADERLDGEVFNLGHPDHKSLLELVGILQKHADLDSACIPFPNDYAAIEMGDYYGDFSKFQAATGWTPRVDLETGIAATMRFFREYGQHYREER
jgi:nucleoside-diphosphate-sugar epimerase